MTCPYINTASVPLNLDAYRYLPRDGKHLIQSWFNRAYRRRGCAPEKSFEPFIFAWISFNGWASCVTGKDRDSDMVQCVADCTNLRHLFTDLLSSESDFASEVNQFAKLWPIFKAQDVRKHGYNSAPSNSREEIIKEFSRHADIDFAPECALYHMKRGEVIPRDWPHSLHTIYRVRCNLFHGEKSLHSEMDALIVKSAFDVLMDFLTKTEMIVSNHQLHR